jgi:hypothetical protein
VFIFCVSYEHSLVLVCLSATGYWGDCRPRGRRTVCCRFATHGAARSPTACASGSLRDTGSTVYRSPVTVRVTASKAFWKASWPRVRRKHCPARSKGRERTGRRLFRFVGRHRGTPPARRQLVRTRQDPITTANIRRIQPGWRCWRCPRRCRDPSRDPPAARPHTGPIDPAQPARFRGGFVRRARSANRRLEHPHSAMSGRSGSVKLTRRPSIALCTNGGTESTPCSDPYPPRC